jgi:hypothetical protein
MILLCGIPSETPLALVGAEIDELGLPYQWFNQRRVASYSMWWEVVGGDIRGELDLGEGRVRLQDVTGVYTRLMDDRILPELRGEPEGSPARRQSRAIHDALFQWYEVAPARVVNRAEDQGSNSSKPYQAQLITQYGFKVPETLVTNQPDLVRDFVAQHGQVIYKSISAMRSIVQLVTDDDLDRLDLIRWCPVQFQAFVPGTNVRVHTVGSLAFPTAVTTDTTDYRYAHALNGETSLAAAELSDDLVGRCLDLAAGLGLPFAGIDLKITPEGEVYCFEVNPSPAFSYYELNTGQPIARAVARYLAGGAA